MPLLHWLLPWPLGPLGRNRQVTQRRRRVKNHLYSSKFSECFQSHPVLSTCVPPPEGQVPTAIVIDPPPLGLSEGEHGRGVKFCIPPLKHLNSSGICKFISLTRTSSSHHKLGCGLGYHDHRVAA